ncbi:hypothetical protein SEA_PHLOP_91 [Gordonia phage Phlop]|uniref:Uncharacterized protein n=7 Tax=Wizardvirus TaxID=2169658 RepID=A0A4Y5U0J0_9CAUD|nr:hypothetical protein BH794_gp89 [Gordonia phage Wizard]YP_010096792.1 hypothetical protein KNT96_gp92 [Gordonia phage KimmyK]YP_010102345.1 hypothetical protein KNU56_gp94 [Gordonia phage Arri]YP_010102440.1 hypothetical protein KNU57_gp95 [Gordonia phage Valary]YP_010104311.1 hypothetical protein KNU74_gp97 [Gordonia phage Fireball]YP_010115010.1 hypothetical protein KNV78_gp91 [Gordonia phage Phlop]UVK63802.1 hypothetical protein SEA_PULLUMCAVEA_92 [Gordonia phage PullumCavea]WNO27960.1
MKQLLNPPSELTDLEAEIAKGWEDWEAMPDSAARDQLRDELWAREDRADRLIDQAGR